MKTEVERLYLCPECRQPLAGVEPCFCAQEEIAAIRPFLKAYEQVRRAEGWGGDDLDLPFHPKRHRDIWAIRQRTFRVFESLVSDLPRGLAIDVGAGNCWMTRYLSQWGFNAMAVDINDNPVDGLQAGSKFFAEGLEFLRVQAGMEQLPVASRRITLVALNASFHYARDFRATLSEFQRVLAPNGIIAIIDTPFYTNADDGERMVAERVVAFRRKYGITEALARSSSYLTFEGLEELAGSLNLKSSVHQVWPGWKRKYEEIRAGILGYRIAQFPVVVLEQT